MMIVVSNLKLHIYKNVLLKNVTNRLKKEINFRKNQIIRFKYIYYTYNKGHRLAGKKYTEGLYYKFILVSFIIIISSDII